MNYEVKCQNYEICGETMLLDYQEYTDLYNDDFVCNSCYDAEDMDFYETIGWDDSDALASAGHGMDEDYL